MRRANPKLLSLDDHPALLAVAAAAGARARPSPRVVSPRQVALRWALQQGGVVALAGSGREAHQVSPSTPRGGLASAESLRSMATPLTQPNLNAG